MPKEMKKVSDITFIKTKNPSMLRGFCGPDGTRTRDLRRDRAAF